MLFRGSVLLSALVLASCERTPPSAKDDTDTTQTDDTDPVADDTDTETVSDDTDEPDPGDDTDTTQTDDTDAIAPDCADATPWTGAGEFTTIASIRTGRHAQGDLLAVRGAIVTAVKAGSGFAMQDPCADEYAGIYVFHFGDFPDPVIGDEVTVIGEYTEFAGSAMEPPAATALAELKAGSRVTDTIVTVTGGGSVTPISLTPAQINDPVVAEKYESMLVRTTAECRFDVDAPPAAGEPSFFELIVSEADEVVHVDNEFLQLDSALPGVRAGDSFSGFVGTLFYSFERYKVALRSATDAQGYVAGGAPDCDPVDTDPVDTDPVDTDPVDTDPVDTDPVDTDPVDTDPVDTDPVDTDPVDTDPVDTDPVDTDPVDTDVLPVVR